jgi:hypothetical protein
MKKIQFFNAAMHHFDNNKFKQILILQDMKLHTACEAYTSLHIHYSSQSNF